MFYKNLCLLFLFEGLGEGERGNTETVISYYLVFAQILAAARAGPGQSQDSETWVVGTQLVEHLLCSRVCSGRRLEWIAEPRPKPRLSI